MVTLKDERFALIETYVRKNQFVTYTDLSKYLGVSKSTIRRDLFSMQDLGKIQIIRGGASTPTNPLMTESPYDQKIQLLNDEKVRIAEAASKLIEPNDTIILDAGTTTRKLVPFLANIENLNIITCDIMIAMDLSNYSNVSVTVLGGNLRKGYFNVSGYFAEHNSEILRADIAFLSFDAISASDKKCMITNIDEIGIKLKFCSIAKKKVALCDHSKFCKDSVVSVCDTKEIDDYFLGNEILPSNLAQFENIHERMHLV